MSAILLIAAVIFFVVAAFFSGPAWCIPLGLALFAASFLIGPVVELIKR